jgi:hypothetical protein
MAALTKHALRTLLKKGHPGALAVLGYSSDPAIAIEAAEIAPASIPIGGSVELRCEIVAAGPAAQQLMIDFAVEYQNASGTGSRKVFKGKVVELAPGQRTYLKRKISLQPLSTRAIFPGPHFVEVQVNGTVFERLGFAVTT